MKSNLVHPRSWTFQTDDLDQAVEFLTREFGDNHQGVLGSGRLHLELAAAAGLRAISGWWSTGVGQLLRASTAVPVLHLPVAQHAQYSVGRRRLDVSSQVAVVLAPGHEYTRRTPPGVTQALWLDPEQLAEAVDLRTRARPRAPSFDSLTLPLSGPEVGELRNLLRCHFDLVRAIERGAGNTLELARVERRLAAWLASRLAARQGMRASSAASVVAAEAVEDWIRTHLAESITLDRLAAVAGLTGRGLQKACLARWGLSPMDLVASRRLDAVRRRLSCADAQTTVTRIATECGFTHLGRFTGLYKSTFGESPSQTLGRARGY